MNMLAQMSWGQFLLAMMIIFVCCFLMLVILLQRGRGSGLAGAFGGGGGSSAFGAKTGDVFTWITVVVAAIFLVGSAAGSWVFDQSPEPVPDVSPIVLPIGSDGESIPVTSIKIPPLPTGDTAKSPKSPQADGDAVGGKFGDPADASKTTPPPGKTPSKP